MTGVQADIHTKILTASTTEELMGIYDNWLTAMKHSCSMNGVIPVHRRRLSSSRLQYRWTGCMCWMPVVAPV